ncbi:MAG: hypothetical protein IPL08_00510 [Saprospiraceae bacterium]|nr:hypothetical protein [Saprospiraceae bacterium]MBK8668072.1 hypothetical protein [Saprospiraceae bacterium]MBL0099515.1 hypothetical protein [Saprospiraceae bacterium]
MRSLKNLLVVLCFSFVANMAVAGDIPGNKKTETLQIQTMLKSVDFNRFLEKETHLNISFFINAQNEIIVVSTNNKELDSIVKSTLNYQKISIDELSYNKVYTIPVVIR